MFAESGGFRERLTAVRHEARGQSEADAPLCPECGQPMRQRTAKAGKNAGQPFWGCTAYPACKGIREMTADAEQPRSPSTTLNPAQQRSLNA